MVKNIDGDQKLAYVQIIENETPKAFELAHVKAYFTPTHVVQTFFASLHDSLVQFFLYVEELRKSRARILQKLRNQMTLVQTVTR